MRSAFYIGLFVFVTAMQTGFGAAQTNHSNLRQNLCCSKQIA